MAPSQDTFKILFSIRFICDADDQSNVKIESSSILYSVRFVGIIHFATCMHIGTHYTYFIYIYRKMVDLLLAVCFYFVCDIPMYIIRSCGGNMADYTHIDKSITWLSVIIKIKLFSCFSRYRTTHFTLK